MKANLKLEFYKTLVMRTGHITEADNKLLGVACLDARLLNPSILVVLSENEYGYRIRVTDSEGRSPQEFLDGIAALGYSPQFVRIMAIAALHDCYVLELDRDAVPVGGLELFDW